MLSALDQLQLLMNATVPEGSGGSASEQPDWPTRLKACRLVLATAFAALPELHQQYRQAPVDHRSFRLDR